MSASERVDWISNGKIRTVIPAKIVKVLDDRFGRTDHLLETEGLSRAILDDGYNLISLKRYVRFFESAADALGDRSLGLQIGSSIEAGDLGPIGALFAHADNLGEALSDLCRYIAALQSATAMHVSSNPKLGRLTYQIIDPKINVHLQDSEFTLSAVCQLIRQVVDAQWSPLEVHFHHTRTSHFTLTEKLLKSPIMYGMPKDAIIFRLNDLNLKIPNKNRDARVFLERHVTDLLRPYRYNSISEMTSEAIAFLLLYCTPTLSRISEETGYSERTLQRLLSEEGTTFRILLQEQRERYADAMLSSGTKSHDEIARALGYADATVFWRAYKSWTGKPPSGRCLTYSRRS